MKVFLAFVIVVATISKVWAFTWTPQSMMQPRGSKRLRMVSAIDIKPPTVASVPEIQDDDSSRDKGNMRPRASDLGWTSVRNQLSKEFGLTDDGKCREPLYFISYTSPLCSIVFSGRICTLSHATGF